MNIQAEKLELMKLILETDNPKILKSIKNIFIKNNTADFWEKLSQEQKEDIIKGINEINEGNIIDYEDFMKSHRK